jgi:hypothetical protein
MEAIRRCLAEDRFIVTVHAHERKLQRPITLQQIKFVLSHGYHEKQKDCFDVAFAAGLFHNDFS